jgi:hypothetical protein
MHDHRVGLGLSALALLATAVPVRANGSGEDSRGEHDGGANPAEVEPDIDLTERVPDRWLSERADELPIKSPRLRRRLPERCHSRGGYREHCSGPRRVPEPHGEAARRAQRLSLGKRATALLLRLDDAYEEWLEVAEGTDDNPKLHWPVPDGRLGRRFGRTRREELKHRKHLGVDIVADAGTPIEAARGGLVVYSDDTLTGYGNSVMILHEDDFTTFYAHCRANHVFAGQIVERGDKIAEVGKTGFTHAPHLHFEWRQGGWARTPVPMFEDPPERVERLQRYLEHKRKAR